MRPPAGVRRQSVHAVSAACTALSTFDGVDSGTAAITSPVAGLRTGIVCAPAAGSHSPPTKFNNVSCPIITAPENGVGGHLKRTLEEWWRSSSLNDLRPHLGYDNRTADDLAAREGLVAGVRLIEREALRDHRLGTEDALRREADDLGHVGARARAVRTDDAQLAAHEARDLHRCGRLARRDAHRHHAAAVANHLKRLRESLRQAQHLEGDVDAP